jgi:Protein of unknown function (DUF4238)
MSNLNLNSPRGHHYIPQFLLKGFASRHRRNQYFSWLFRPGAKPVEANLKNIAKIRDFHGGPLDNLEAQMSHLETSQAELVHDLRNCRGLERSVEISEFVVSMQIRSENVRAVMSATTQQFMTMMSKKFAGEKAREALTSGVMDVIVARAEAGQYAEALNHLPPEERSDAMRRALSLVSAEMPSFFEQFSGMFSDYVSEMDFDATTANSHRNALQGNLIPPARLQKLSGFQWSVESDEEVSFLLGDVGVLADIGMSTHLQNIMAVEDTLEALYLPISSNRLLVGRINGSVPLRRACEVNAATVALSTEFFVSKISTAEILEMHTQLGCRAALYSEAQMEKLLPVLSKESVIKSLSEGS